MRKAISVRLPYALLEDCRAFARSNGIGLTDMIIAGLVNQLKTAKSQPYVSMPEPSISGVASSCEADIPANRPARHVPPATRAPNKPVLSLDAIKSML